MPSRGSSSRALRDLEQRIGGRRAAWTSRFGSIRPLRATCVPEDGAGGRAASRVVTGSNSRRSSRFGPRAARAHAAARAWPTPSRGRRSPADRPGCARGSPTTSRSPRETPRRPRPRARTTNRSPRRARRVRWPACTTRRGRASCAPSRRRMGTGEERRGTGRSLRCCERVGVARVLQPARAANARRPDGRPRPTAAAAACAAGAASLEVAPGRSRSPCQLRADALRAPASRQIPQPSVIATKISVSFPAANAGCTHDNGMLAGRHVA